MDPADDQYYEDLTDEELVEDPEVLAQIEAIADGDENDGEFSKLFTKLFIYLFILLQVNKKKICLIKINKDWMK